MHLADHVGQTRPGAGLPQSFTSDQGCAYGTWKSYERLDAGSSAISPLNGPAAQNRRLASSEREPLAGHLRRRTMSAIPEARGAGAVDDCHPLVAAAGSRPARTAENAAASTTAAVPCMSSLNEQHVVGVACPGSAGRC